MRNIPPVVMLYVLDPLERAGRTFIQQFSTVLLAGGGSLLVTQDWAFAADSAAFAAVVSILTSVLTFKVPKLSVGADLFLRVGKTYLQSFAGTLTASAVLDVSHADWRGALAIGVPTALTALITGLAAMAVPGTERGASLIPLPAHPLDGEGVLPPTGVAEDDDEVYPDYSDVQDEPLSPDEPQPRPGGELDDSPEHAARE